MRRAGRLDLFGIGPSVLVFGERGHGDGVRQHCDSKICKVS